MRPVLVDLKKCSNCKIDKPRDLIHFHAKKINSDGLNGKCKQCRKGEHKLWINTPEKKLRYNLGKRKYDRTTGYIRKLLRSYSCNDKKRNRVCSITQEWIEQNIINKPCTYCGDNDPTQIGVDRIDNSIGHTPANSVPCCRVCNVVRGNIFSVDEMKQIGAVITNIKKTRRVLKTYNRSEYEYMDTKSILDNILSLCN
jgi:hypothetical protein